MSSPKVYVASPLGFSAPSRRFYRVELLPRLRQAGFLVLDPWAGKGTGKGNVKLLSEADALFTVLDGADVDSGTASEIGWAAARGLPIIGWRSDIRKSGERSDVIVNLQVQYFVELTGGAIERKLGRAIKRLRTVVPTAT